MSVVSELSMLELAAERGELLPERETLHPFNVVNLPIITQINVNSPIVNVNSPDVNVNSPIITQVAVNLNLVSTGNSNVAHQLISQAATIR